MEISARLTNYNKNSICRICMQSGDHNLFPIFNEIFFGDDTITVADIITECTKYPVTLNDQLPDQICNPCMEAARNAHQFKRQTEEAYCHLKELYDITWVHEAGKNSICGGMRVGVTTTDKYTQTDKSTVFQCESCPKKFFIETELREHRATIHVYDGKKCRVCGDTFNHLGQLKVHLSTEHPSEGIRCEFKCNICSREFTRKDHLKRHLMHVHKISEESLNSQKVSEHHDRSKIIKPTKTLRPDIKPNAIKCKEYRERQKLKKKITDKSSKIPLEEPEIENPAVLSANVNNYSSHWPDYQEEDENEPIGIGSQNKETVAATNPFSSDDEEHRDFNNMNEYDVKKFVETIAHPEISIKEEPSDIMDAYSYDDIMEPEAIIPEENGGEDEYITNNDYEYEYYFPKKRILPDDYKYQRNPETNMYYCVECQLEFKLRRNLVRHMLTHTDERPFACHLCFKTFKRKDNLQKHLRDVHQKNFGCDKCDKKFGSMQQLMRHKKTHRTRRNN